MDKLSKEYNELLLRYNSLFEESRDIIYICDSGGNIKTINPHGVTILGYSSKTDLIGMNVTDLYYSQSDRDHYLLMMGENGFIKDFEIILKKKGGAKLFGLESANVIRDPEGAVFEYAGIIKDITDRVTHEMHLVQINIELVEINKKLEEAQRKIIRQEKLASIGQLAAGIAHEINNPLGYIKSCFGSLRTYMEKVLSYMRVLEDFSSKTKEYAEPGSGSSLVAEKQRLKIDVILNDFVNIQNETDEGFEKITAIIDGLKNFAHADSARKIINYDLNSGIENTLQILTNEIKYVATVEKKLSPLPLIECIGGEINQVLLNVILNAAQAIKGQKKNTLGKIVVATEAQPGHVVCTVHDDGPGIPEDIIGKIFDPFFTTKDVGEGTGLGLNISYDIVSKHGGELSVQSDAGRGTEFGIRLPIQTPIKKEENE
jgi:two-component system, NtrC family, sensor kinase